MFFSIIEGLIIKIIKILPESILWAIKSHSKAVKKMDYKGHDIFIKVDTRAEYKNRLNSSLKEPELVEWIHSQFKKGDVFYDVGANVGSYSLIAYKYLQGEITVYAFEPGFMNFSRLCENILLNKASHAIRPLQIALSNSTIETIFNYSRLMPGYAHHALGEAVDFKGEKFDPVFKQMILSYKIDDLLKQFNLPIPNHLKIDVDGIEYEILLGAETTLKNKQVRSIYVEIQQNEDSDKYISYLKNMGFRFHSKHPHFDKTNLSQIMNNYIFVR